MRFLNFNRVKQIFNINNNALYSIAGAKCGDGKMCVNRKCMSVESLRAAEPHFCDCNGHGVCNTKGNCHCDPGYAPPFCNSPGVGGSSDSGPAANPNGTYLMLIH